MSDYTPKVGTGSVFKNENKKTEKSPDYSGTFNYKGELIKFSGFINVAKNGTKYIGLKQKDMDAQAPAAQASDDEGWI